MIEAGDGSSGRASVCEIGHGSQVFNPVPVYVCVCVCVCEYNM